MHGWKTKSRDLILATVKRSVLCMQTRLHVLMSQGPSRLRCRFFFFSFSLALDATLSREALLLHMWRLRYRGTVGLIVGQTGLGLRLDSGSWRSDEGVADVHTVLGRLAKVLLKVLR